MTLRLADLAYRSAIKRVGLSRVRRTLATYGADHVDAVAVPYLPMLVKALDSLERMKL